jgi:hypothetical protein
MVALPCHSKKVVVVVSSVQLTVASFSVRV